MREGSMQLALAALSTSVALVDAGKHVVDMVNSRLPELVWSDWLASLRDTVYYVGIVTIHDNIGG
jgi:hypothetical protein